MAVKLEILSQQQQDNLIILRINQIAGSNATPNDQNIFSHFDVVHRVLTGHVLHTSS